MMRGGSGWSGGKWWRENGDNCTWTTIKKKEMIKKKNMFTSSSTCLLWRRLGQSMLPPPLNLLQPMRIQPKWHYRISAARSEEAMTSHLAFLGHLTWMTRWHTWGIHPIGVLDPYIHLAPVVILSSTWEITTNNPVPPHAKTKEIDSALVSWSHPWIVASSLRDDPYPLDRTHWMTRRGRGVTFFIREIAIYKNPLPHPKPLVKTYRHPATGEARTPLTAQH